MLIDRVDPELARNLFAKERDTHREQLKSAVRRKEIWRYTESFGQS
jgi:hypothetical protein